MDYEKKYKEALEIAKRCYKDLNNLDGVVATMSKDFFEEVFPKLKESEDEQSKKWILEYLYDGLRKSDEQFKDQFTAAIAWLEKQGEQKPIIEMKSPEESLGISSKEYNEIVNECLYGEQKPADRVEPKFQNGQWIVWQNKCYKVNYNGCGYELIDQNGLRTSLEYGTVDKSAHLWTIQDAKDGDVLKEDSCIFIIKKMNPNGMAIVHCCLFDDSELDLTSLTLGFDVDSTHPATKEQRDLLFSKMKEAGYEWDDEKKELKKIEQKPSWSEEDERMCQETIDWFEKKCFPYALESENPARENIKWLKSLKDRVHPKQEWSEH